jgi:hypothetical protein
VGWLPGACDDQGPAGQFLVTRPGHDTRRDHGVPRADPECFGFRKDVGYELTRGVFLCIRFGRIVLVCRRVGATA